jgi:hypothetical protein
MLVVRSVYKRISPFPDTDGLIIATEIVLNSMNLENGCQIVYG